MYQFQHDNRNLPDFNTIPALNPIVGMHQPHYDNKNAVPLPVTKTHNIITVTIFTHKDYEISKLIN